MDPAALGLYYALPLALWILFLALVAWALRGATLEDGFAYLVILRNRRTRFIGLLVVLAGSQVVKDVIQVAWGLGTYSEVCTFVVSIICNVLSAAALVGLVWTLLSKGALTAQEDRVLSQVAEALYAVGRPGELAETVTSESSPPTK